MIDRAKSLAPLSSSQALIDVYPAPNYACLWNRLHVVSVSMYKPPQVIYSCMRSTRPASGAHSREPAPAQSRASRCGILRNSLYQASVAVQAAHVQHEHIVSIQASVPTVVMEVSEATSPLDKQGAPTRRLPLSHVPRIGQPALCRGNYHNIKPLNFSPLVLRDTRQLRNKRLATTRHTAARYRD